MQPSVFAVNDEPYCLLEIDPVARNRAFLDGIDPDYFDYLLQVHAEAEGETRAAVAIKLSLHHALETMFSLLGAFVQAPQCSYAWIAKCSNQQLREFVERVSRGVSNFDIDHVIDESAIPSASKDDLLALLRNM